MHVTVDNPIGETNVLVMRVGMPYAQKYGCAFHAYPKVQNDNTSAFDMATADLTFRDYFEFQSFVLTVNRMAAQLEDELHMQMVSRYEPLPSYVLDFMEKEHRLPSDRNYKMQRGESF